LWETVNRQFFDPRMNGVDFAAVRERYRPLFAQVTSDAAFLELGNRMIRELGTSHLDVIPPPGHWERVAGPPRGLVSERFRIAPEGLFYFAAAPGVPAEGLRQGDQILSTPADLSGPPGGGGTIRVRGCDNVERAVPVTYAVPPKITVPFHERSVISGPGGRKVAYARVGTFNDDTIGFADQLMAASKDTDGMIIDVRNNSGGSLSLLHLANYFVTGSGPAVSLVGRSVLARLGRMPTAQDIAGLPLVKGRYRLREVLPVLMDKGAVTFTFEGRGERGYTKPVTVLVNARSGSAAEGFAWVMQEGTRATIVGRKTAGSLLRGQQFPLPDGWKVTVPIFGLWAPDGRSFIDKAVTPDVEVQWTRQDFCANRDADIAAAMRAMFPS
jgi:carboxyl-terminal processing protease